MRTIGKATTILTGSVLTATLALVGCGGGNQPASVSGQPKNNPDAVYRELDGWPAPPQFQGNPFSSGGIGWRTWVFSYVGLFQSVRSTDKIIYRLATSVDESVPGQTTVKMRHDAKWSDGQPVTSKDIWAYYTLNNGEELNNYLTGIETPDDYTVVFKWAQPAPFDQLKLLFIAEANQGQIPYHYYKQWVDKAASLLQQAKPDTDPKDRGTTPFNLKITPDIRKQLDANWNDFMKHGPKFPLVDGPYVVTKVTANELFMEKNKYYYDANKVHFKKIVNMNVSDLNQQFALAKTGKLDYWDGTPPRDILESILASNKNLVHYQMFDPACVGFLFNTAHKPFDNKTFRQAVIYALDRNKIREVANYYGVNSNFSGVAMPTAYVSQWVSPDVLAKFTMYPHDETKAAELLQQIGWKKGADGTWRDASGKSYNFLIASDGSWAPAVSAGELVAEQLTAFGLPTKYKAVDSGVYWGNVDNKTGAYDMSFDWVDVTWGFGYPWNAMRNSYWWNSWKHAHLPANKAGEADFVRVGFDGQTINVSELLHQIPFMQSESDRTHAIEEVAYVTNEDAWEVNLFNNVTGTWYNNYTMQGLPWPDGIQKYHGDLPLPPAAWKERVAETNDFAGSQSLIDGNLSPR